ncbi:MULTISPECIES: winged helix-turn-helix transcriptional regulator [Bacteroidota]|jgi:DNA-binding HxlR family transcriptional regulator|uniref:Transcriptional regulator n=2 Tax=Bacteroidota TaxID=976 RepID=A0A291QXY2_9BACT|nr:MULTISPECIES: helix-turn-helix domain-containing protein [Bacteroidota]ATL48805.1 transcriptional regulator [Chitinophaga caeni]MDV3793744.1 transcriptional regulator [Elizabethkingia anophelis]MDV3830912.1 transcriptional regulator [Elizabethkingia anophelis]MVZ62471.1 transcriptional regulator [Sphingobacterium humi]
MEKDTTIAEEVLCKSRILAIKDTSDILCGKWKIFILGTLLVTGKMRFMELLHTIDGIGKKMLSKELHDLELNGLIHRTEIKTKPITVEYQLSKQGKTLSKLIEEMITWGSQYRKDLLNLHEKKMNTEI